MHATTDNSSNGNVVGTERLVYVLDVWDTVIWFLVEAFSAGEKRGLTSRRRPTHEYNWLKSTEEEKLGSTT